jgi:hypothetical protein
MRNVPVLWLLLSCLGLALAASAGVAHALPSSTLDRPSDPVVLTGVDVPWLSGLDPDDLVAFRYDGGWQQIPVQVDERTVRDFADVYNVGGGSGEDRGDAAGQAYPKPTGVTEFFYADSGTFTGPDADATLDGDDEIAFMAKDAGGEPPSFSEPSGVVTGSGVKVSITDSLDPGAAGYVYLFESGGTLSPGAGQQYVSYTFDLLSGPYLTTYSTLDGPNPEDSLVTTPYYSHHFSDRWISDEITITTGGASGVDILDRHKNLFGPGVCGRSEDSFSDGEGAFVANRSGPVRTIRSYVGANSGPLTQRDHIFYERREDIRTFLRVHSIPGVMDFFDYSPAASGMTYYDNANPSGVIIDGDPDTVTQHSVLWGMVTGAQGSLVNAGTVSTDIAGLTYTLYYLDDTTPADTQCTGDAYAYGSSGLWVDQGIACTDPSQGCSNFLQGTRVLYYEAPGLTVSDAEDLADRAMTPLAYTASPFTAGAVGGIAELPELSELSLHDRSPADGNHAPIAALGVSAALGAIVLSGVVWVTRRRISRTR